MSANDLVIDVRRVLKECKEYDKADLIKAIKKVLVPYAKAHREWQEKYDEMIAKQKAREQYLKDHPWEERYEDLGRQ
jgi:hypothetical protein